MFFALYVLTCHFQSSQPCSFFQPQVPTSLTSITSLPIPRYQYTPCHSPITSLNHFFTLLPSKPIFYYLPITSFFPSQAHLSTSQPLLHPYPATVLYTLWNLQGPPLILSTLSQILFQKQKDAVAQIPKSTFPSRTIHNLS